MVIGTLFFIVFFASIFFSMLGVGGGVLYTPLQFFFGIEFHNAAATSLFLICITSLSSTIIYRRAKRIDWGLALVLEIATTAGGLAGALWSNVISERILVWVFTVVVTLAAAFMVLRLDEHKEALGKKDLSGESAKKRGFNPWAWQREVGELRYTVNLVLACPFSFGVGLLSGLLGVGGGVFKVPLMVLLLGVPMEIAVGSSAFMVGVTALAGWLGHVYRGHWQPELGLILAVAVFVGSRIGATRSVRMDRVVLKRWFAFLLVVVAVGMLFKG